MAISGISGISGLSGIGIGEEEAGLVDLNTTNLLARFVSSDANTITLANATAVSDWSPYQLGPIPSFNFTRSNTVNSQSPIYVANDSRFGKPAIQIGFNNKAFRLNTVNAAFANAGLTVHCVLAFDATPRTGLIVRYRNPLSPFYSANLETRNVGGTGRLTAFTFDAGGAGTNFSSNTTSINTKYLITYTKQGSQVIIRVNGSEWVNAFETAHWNTVGSGGSRDLVLGGSGFDTVTAEMTPASLLDLSFYQTSNATLIADVEGTLANTYGITI